MMEPLDVGAFLRLSGSVRSNREARSLAGQSESDRKAVAKLLAWEVKVASFRKARGRS